MKQRMYLKAASAISPQHTFYPADFLIPLERSDTGRLNVVEPDYKPYINPVAIRRMSRLIKMSISAAMQSLKDAGVETPDAIITGTGRGSMSDMEVFLKDMIRLNEGALNPTIFIQSTYNSPNGWIALQSKSTAYNQTYVHRGCSFELALLDAQLLFAEQTATQNVLVGCYDELTDEYVIIKDKVQYWKHPAPESTDLFQHSDSPGTIGGEGAAFFTLSNEQGTAKSAIEDIHLMQEVHAAGIMQAIVAMLDRHNIGKENIDLVLTGINGDHRYDSLYKDGLDFLGTEIPVAAYKHLCGEYDTATGFGLWLANWMLQQETIPEILLRSIHPPTQSIKKILFINHYITGSAVVILISKT